MQTSRPHPIRVLVACERSGVVRRAFRALGCDAWSCDLSPADDGSRRHIQDDAREAIKWGVPTLHRSGELRYNGAHVAWDLLIAHPPCTYLCNSGVSRMRRTPPNPSPGVLYGEDRRIAMHDAAQLVADLWISDVPHIAIENPIMYGEAREAITTKAQDFQAPTQTVQPYQFGDDASKRTALWLRGLPCLQAPDRAQWIAPRIVHGRPRWGNQTDSGQNKLTPSADRAALRAETYPGIARAMAEQWIAYITQQRNAR